MSVRCSSRHPIPFACSLALLLVATRAPAQQPDEVLVAELARLLAAADARAFDPALLRGALGHPQPTVRRQAALAAGRIGDPGAVDLLVAALRDSDRAVQAAAAFALGMLKGPRAVGPRAARFAPGGMAGAVGLRRGGAGPAVRVTALRALASFRDSALAGAAASLATDPDVNVAVQAETTLGALGGSVAVRALAAGGRSAVFALRRQAVIGLAQADSAAGAAAAAALATDPDWRWRSVACAAFGAARDRARLEGALADPDGRVVAQALQALA